MKVSFSFLLSFLPWFEIKTLFKKITYIYFNTVQLSIILHHCFNCMHSEKRITQKHVYILVSECINKKKSLLLKVNKRCLVEISFPVPLRMSWCLY